MRISREETNLLLNEFKKIAPEAIVYLFGSRLDDTKRGGDIDIMILTNLPLTREQKWEVKFKFYEKFGEQKLDFVNFTFKTEDSFKEMILQEGKEL